MSVLIPMSAETFVHYQAAAVAGYAKENVNSGRWPEEGAVARSQAAFAESLPQGLLRCIDMVLNQQGVGFTTRHWGQDPGFLRHGNK